MHDACMMSRIHTWQIEVLSGGLQLLVIAGHDSAVIDAGWINAPLMRQVAFQELSHDCLDAHMHLYSFFFRSLLTQHLSQSTLVVLHPLT